MAAPLLQMKGVVKRYGPARVLKGVDITGEAGEVHALMGENGAGKSTLMKILSGAVRRDEGEVLLDGEPAELGDPTRAWELGIHAVYQEFSLVPNLSVAENIRLGQKGSGGSRWWVDWRNVNASARKILEEIGFAGIDVRRPVSELSVAGRQMVEIAKAVAEPPRILILDEPSAVLSGTDLERLFGLVRRLAEEGTLVFYISHRLEEVFEIADRITVLKDGELVGTLPPDEADERTLIRMMVGRTLEEIYPSRNREPGEEVLTVSGLSREGSFSDVSFGLARGEILGLFGLVGSGRTELARCIFGADAATSGEMRLEGAPYRPKSPGDAVRAGVAYVTENRGHDGLVLNESVSNNVNLASLGEVSRWNFFDSRAQDRRALKLVKELDVRPPDIGRPVSNLSGGNQQKVVLAKWLLTGAKVLILDEPTRGVDVGAKVDIYRNIAELARQGQAILLISSELPEILGMSDRVLVIREGRVEGEIEGSRATEEGLLALASGVTA